MLENATIVTTCRGRLMHLKQTLPIMTRHAPVIVVDYSDEDRSGDWVVANHPEVRVVVVTGQEYFNASKARNAGAAAVQTEWIVWLDADRIPSDDFANEVEKVLKPGTFLASEHWNQRNGFNGISGCSVDDLKKSGGWPEISKCWAGHEDGFFLLRLYDLGLKHVWIPSRCVSHIDHDDALRVKHYEEKHMPTGCGHALEAYQKQRADEGRKPV